MNQNSETANPLANDQIRIVYDKQCPACDGYCQLAKASAAPSRVVLVDAREASALMREITKRGLDIDEGMVVEIAGELHYGAEAIRALAMADNESNLFNWFNRVMFKSSAVAHKLYPALSAVRNLLLKLLGITRINNLGRPGNGKF